MASVPVRPVVGSGVDNACRRLSEKQLLTFLSHGRLGRKWLAFGIGALRAGAGVNAVEPAAQIECRATQGYLVPLSWDELRLSPR
jgi:hypothetical protein